MTALQKQIIFFWLVVVAATGCKNKQAESASGQLPQSGSSVSPGALPDTNRHIVTDSVDAKGKPVPAIPIEEMTRTQLTAYKQLLIEKGFFDCCIEPSCRMCLFEFEECPCKHRAKREEGVCDQCFDGWQAGKGNVKGVKPDEITRMSK